MRVEHYSKATFEKHLFDGIIKKGYKKFSSTSNLVGQLNYTLALSFKPIIESSRIIFHLPFIPCVLILIWKVPNIRTNYIVRRKYSRISLIKIEKISWFNIKRERGKRKHTHAQNKINYKQIHCTYFAVHFVRFYDYVFCYLSD